MPKKSQSKALAKLLGRSRYNGKICVKHPELNGARYVNSGECPVCAMKKVADYRATPRGRRNVLANARQRKYSVSQQQFDVLLAAQGGRCGICRADAPGGRDNTWHLDHDHASGRPRGVLCVRCNVGLGCFSDNEINLLLAVNYLRQDV